ncbi:MAG: acyl-CoA dehydrogenase family protein [Gammaproteobacteria bacterium]|nr:acyl-CoA dehydrogenase family protein [Gammaproteobacteria bacterium]
MALEDFRGEARDWLEDNCPPGARAGGRGNRDDGRMWRDRLIEKGWSAPTWPAEYGGGGLDNEEYMVLIQELRRIRASVPFGGMGLSLIGPTLLELGTEDQKRRHIPPIVRGEVNWCQGYSEPSSGSDLASLRTRAVDNGDHFVINGQKIWTSGAQFADWMFALVRTDPDVPKHEGISFVLLTMHQPGVTVKPIRLISGSSPFCETFFDDAIAKKEDLVGELNKGWTIGKRLLQFERGSMASLVGGAAVREAGPTLEGRAKEYAGEQDGRIADDALRGRIIEHNINNQAYRLTQRRTVEEATDGRTPGPATSIFKMYGTELQQDKSSLLVEMRGTRGLGWEGLGFDDAEIGDTRAFLANRAASIYSGSNEIQRNIIAKRVLGLPD